MLMRIRRSGRKTSDYLQYITISKTMMKMKTKELSTRFTSVFFKPTQINKKAQINNSSKSSIK